MMQPEQDDIAHFVARVREIDKRAAVNHYIRTGQKLNAEPDPVVARVLEWLDGLARR